MIENYTEAQRSLFEEYLEVVTYHLEFAESAERECSSVLFMGYGREDLAFGRDENTVYLTSFSATDLVRFGDVSIRESASVLDAALLLTNHLLGLGVHQKHVSWRTSQASRSVRAQLERLPDGKGNALVRAIDAIWDSIGHELQETYRNWVTHRGAPRVLSTIDFSGPISIPEHILEIQNIREREFTLRSFLIEQLLTEIQVQCAPFHPPLSLIFSSVDSAGNEFINAHVANGSLLDHKDEYRQRNPITPEGSRVTVAGEELATYNGSDYIRAVERTFRFAQRAVTESWDEELMLLLRAQLVTSK